MDFLLPLLSTLGINGILLFFIKRYFDRRDKRERELAAEQEARNRKLDTSMETIRLLSYARMSEEIERLLSKGYATPAERRVLDEMYANYKAHGWNGDMDARLKRVYAMRTDHAK